jgi:hypothetical protein
VEDADSISACEAAARVEADELMVKNADPLHMINPESPELSVFVLAPSTCSELFGSRVTVPDVTRYAIHHLSPSVAAAVRDRVNVPDKVSMVPLSAATAV